MSRFEDVRMLSAAEAANVVAMLDPGLNSWLRYALDRDDLSLFTTSERGLVGIATRHARLSNPISEDDARSLGRATASMQIDEAWGDPRCVRAFVQARADAAEWSLVHPSHEMIKVAPAVPRAVPGEPKRVSELVGADSEVPPPFDVWMVAFFDEALRGHRNRPIVGADELWAWVVDGEPRAMAGEILRGADSMRVVTVYTPMDHRGRGFAGALVATMTERAIGCGRAHVTLSVAKDNTCARRAYERAGFRKVFEAEMWALSERSARPACRTSS